MATNSGLTSFGIIRRRMADLYREFADRLKEGGAFGPQTTVDEPDKFPGDPLVQIATAATASAHELWEAVEYFYAQLDYKTASGIYLERMHGTRVGVLRGVGETDEDYKQRLSQLIEARPSRSSPEAIAMARPDVECAAIVLSTTANPVEDIPAPGAMLVVKGCDIDYAALAQDLFNGVELGLHTWYGDIEVGYGPPNGGCVQYRFQPAQPVFLAVEIIGYFTDPCMALTPESVIDTALGRLEPSILGCALGSRINAASVVTVIGQIDGFMVTGVRLARRAKQLVVGDCEPDGLISVELCGETIIWATSVVCGPGAGEVWCPGGQQCVDLRPWEYPTFDPRFITLTQDPTYGGCE